MQQILTSLLYMLNEMSPYILLGFLVAGILEGFVSARMLSRHLSGEGIKPVLKSALIGIPLPLCSCGVLPAAVALKRSGASNGSTVSFLIATPQTGVDSIAATYSLLGPAFAIVRPVAALITAIFGGYITSKADPSPGEISSGTKGADEPYWSTPFTRRIKTTFVYGFHMMVRSIGKWLVLGLIIAALITVLVPDTFFTSLAEYPLLAMLAMVAVAVPMYICATGSIPIALSLILKGLSPGTALVLLMAGPAVNFASIAVISKNLGKKTSAIYLLSIILGAVAFGLTIDYLLPREWFTGHLGYAAGACHHSIPIFESVCSGILTVLLLLAFILPLCKMSKTKCNKYQCDNINMETKTYHISGMNCVHCQNRVEKAISGVPGVETVEVNLSKGTAFVVGKADKETVKKSVEDAGYEVTEIS